MLMLIYTVYSILCNIQSQRHSIYSMLYTLYYLLDGRSGAGGGKHHGTGAFSDGETNVIIIIIFIVIIMCIVITVMTIIS